ncbi:hypothetical protein GCM10009544_00440 [Streptomyces stramineus]|uniref:Uncharacterized protein n=1 Tax=Streptomyces stramineus TaxID=173861 RepID=A0ABN0ZBQ6_9ACTN
MLYVVIAPRPGFPEAGTRDRALAAIARAGLSIEGAPDTEIHPELYDEATNNQKGLNPRKAPICI